MKHNLIDNPDFNDTESLTKQIKKCTLKFIKDAMEFLFKKSNRF
jgi:hypothetical protein